jgi:hypothetical protein
VHPENLIILAYTPKLISLTKYNSGKFGGNNVYELEIKFFEQKRNIRYSRNISYL